MPDIPPTLPPRHSGRLALVSTDSLWPARELCLPEVLRLDLDELEAAAATTRQRVADEEGAAARERFRLHLVG